MIAVFHPYALPVAPSFGTAKTGGSGSPALVRWAS